MAERARNKAREIVAIQNEENSEYTAHDHLLNGPGAPKNEEQKE
jgi:hypothetical protein